jgi:excisionase family DNA binding protein
MAMAHPEFVTVKEAAVILRYDPDTVWRKIRRGEIPGVVHHGRMIRIRTAALFHVPRTAADASGRE